MIANLICVIRQVDQGTRSIRGTDLRSVIDTVAQYRQVEIEPLDPLTANMPDLAQRKWERWRIVAVVTDARTPAMIAAVRVRLNAWNRYASDRVS